MHPETAFIGTVEVPEGNGIRYGQDHRIHEGIPAGRYSVYRFGANGLKLIAPGYGLTSDYGNGALFVSNPASPVFAQLIQGVEQQHAPTSI
jgi:hypothetical protein